MIARRIALAGLMSVGMTFAHALPVRANPAAARMAPRMLAVVRDTPANVDTRFLLGMLTDARAQIALAHLAQERHADGPVFAVASEAGALWQETQSDLETIAHALHITPPGDVDPRQLGAAIKLARTNEAAFDAAYLQSVARADHAALVRMESLDAGSTRTSCFSRTMRCRASSAWRTRSVRSSSASGSARAGP